MTGTNDFKPCNVKVIHMALVQQPVGQRGIDWDVLSISTKLSSPFATIHRGVWPETLPAKLIFGSFEPFVVIITTPNGHDEVMKSVRRFTQFVPDGFLD